MYRPRVREESVGMVADADADADVDVGQGVDRPIDIRTN